MRRPMLLLLRADTLGTVQRAATDGIGLSFLLGTEEQEEEETTSGGAKNTNSRLGRIVRVSDQETKSNWYLVSMRRSSLERWWGAVVSTEMNPASKPRSKS